MTTEKWGNLGLAAVVAFYLVQFGLDIYWRNTCGHMAIDYCTFWSAGRIADEYGYARVYDLGLIGEIQKAVFPPAGNPSRFAVVPTPYLPVFVLPFQLFALLDPASGFWLWTLLNLAAYCFYLRFFTLETTKAPLPTRLLLLVSLSLPVFLNFFYGQVNVWLTICIGEFLRAAVSERPWRAGLWLGGLLIKPQSLILIIPALLHQRAFKTLGGFAASSVAILGTSFAMIGTGGYRELLELWRAFAGGFPPAIGAQVMMNWRMIGINLNSVVPSGIGWVIVAAGITVTLLAAVAIWRHPIHSGRPEFGIALLGTLAATGLVAWHSHVYTSIMLIAPLIYVARNTDSLPNGAILSWAFIPTLMYFTVIPLELLVHLGVLAPNINSLLNLLLGGGAFGLNLYFLVWAVRCLQNPGVRPGG